jgi:hypothetical protein
VRRFALHELTATLTTQENVMQNVKYRFNQKARRKTYLDLILLLLWLLILIELQRRLQDAPRRDYRLPFRPG